MNRQEYMDTLKKALESFGDEIRDEIVSDYEEHFNMGAAAGKTDEQIADELGSVEELVEELNILSGRKEGNESENGAAGAANEKHDDHADNTDDFVENAANTFSDMMNGLANFLGSMAAGVSKNAVKYSDIAAEKFVKAQEGLNREMDKFNEKYGDKVGAAAGSFAGKVESFFNSASTDKTVNNVKEEAGKVAGEVKDGASRFVSGVKEEAGKFRTEFAKGASGKESVGEKAGRIVGKIAGKTAEAFDNLTDHGTKFGENLGRGAEGAASGISESFGAFSERISEASKKFVDASSAFAKEIARGYKDGLGKQPEGSTGKVYFEQKFTTHDGGFVNANDPDTEEDDDVEDAQFIKFDETVANVVIDADCANVEINGTSDGSMGVSYENHGTPNQQLLYRFSMKQDGDTAFISVKKQPGMTNFFKSLSCPEILLSLDLPETIKSVSVRTLSGDTSVDDLFAESLRVNSVSGDISLDNVMLSALDINTMSGDVNIDDGTVAAINLNSISGDIDYSGKTDEIVARTNSGDVNIECSKDAAITSGTISGDISVELTESEGFVASVSTTSGDISLSFGGESMDNVRSGNYVLGNGTSQVKCTSVSGDVEVNA